MARLRSGCAATTHPLVGGFAMKLRFGWLVAATLVGVVYAAFTHARRARKQRADIDEQVVRWEGEGGNVADA